MKKEYDFSKGQRGRYHKKFSAGNNIVRLDPDVKKHFPNSEAVNKALKSILEAVDFEKHEKKRA
jgi:hypothetical protein